MPAEVHFRSSTGGVLQTSDDAVTRWKWVDYSAFDAKATWDLYHSLREKLSSTDCYVDPELRAGITGCAQAAWYTQWDLYQDVVRPFGELLTDLEQVRPAAAAYATPAGAFWLDVTFCIAQWLHCLVVLLVLLRHINAT